MTGATPPAGWYERPNDASQERYWDGAKWTEQVRAANTSRPASASKPARRSSPATGRRWAWAVCAAVAIVIVAVAVLISGGGGKGTGEAGQYLSPVSYKGFVYKEELIACFLGAHGVEVPRNADAQTMMLVRYCRAREVWRPAPFCGLPHGAYEAYDRSCFSNGLKKEEFSLSGRANALSEVVSTLLPGECRTAFQTMSQAATAWISVDRYYTPKIVGARNEEERRKMYGQYVHAWGPLAHKAVAAGEEIPKGCRP